VGRRYQLPFSTLVSKVSVFSSSENGDLIFSCLGGNAEARKNHRKGRIIDSRIVVRQY